MNKHDLRYAKTEERLRQVYLHLLMSKKQEQITVKEICQEANCSRNTFYLHYETKEDIFKALICQVLGELSDCFELKPGKFKEDGDRLSQIYTAGIIDGISPHKSSILALSRNDYGQFFQAFTKVIFDRCEDGTAQLHGGSLSPGKILQLTYLAYALTGFIFEWVRQDSIDDQQAKRLLFQIHRETMAVCSTSNENPL